MLTLVQKKNQVLEPASDTGAPRVQNSTSIAENDIAIQTELSRLRLTHRLSFTAMFKEILLSLQLMKSPDLKLNLKKIHPTLP